MLDVMRMHQAAVEDIHPACPSYLKEAARQVWAECVASGEKSRLSQRPSHGPRTDRHDCFYDGL